MQVNWTEFDEKAFKDGVARPFLKYIRWMGRLLYSKLVYPYG